MSNSIKTKSRAQVEYEELYRQWSTKLRETGRLDKKLEGEVERARSAWQAEVFVERTR